MTSRKVCLLALIFASMGFSGCASLGVEPWERDLLAKPAMTQGDDAVTLALDDHIYFSKEASTGGAGFGGGGCGCN